VTDLDKTRRGSRHASDADRARVWSAMQRHTSPNDATTTAGLCDETGLQGRVIRAAFESDDGDDYILAGGDDGLYLAEYHEDAERMTRRLEAHALAELRRVARRRAYQDGMPRRQGLLGL